MPWRRRVCAQHTSNNGNHSPSTNFWCTRLIEARYLCARARRGAGGGGTDVRVSKRLSVREMRRNGLCWQCAVWVCGVRARISERCQTRHAYWREMTHAACTLVRDDIRGVHALVVELGSQDDELVPGLRGHPCATRLRVSMGGKRVGGSTGDVGLVM